MTDSIHVEPTLATGWPTITELAAFARADVADEALQHALDGAIGYGSEVLSESYDIPDVTDIPPSVKTACLEYAGSLFVERIGQGDIVIEGLQGSVSKSRYRRTLLAARYTAIA